MVSLLKLAEITEVSCSNQTPIHQSEFRVFQDGVKFRSPHDDSEMVLTPEYSTQIQNTIGADIIMQLDDVVHSSTTGYRVEEAMWRTVRERERGRERERERKREKEGEREREKEKERERERECVFLFTPAEVVGQVSCCSQETHRPEPLWNRAGRPPERPPRNLCQRSLHTLIIRFFINPLISAIALIEMVKRELPGYAIGGLSGGEEKEVFWRVVSLCTDLLPRDKPRYCMGVG